MICDYELTVGNLSDTGQASRPAMQRVLTRSERLLPAMVMWMALMSSFKDFWKTRTPSPRSLGSLHVCNFFNGISIDKVAVIL